MKQLLLALCSTACFCMPAAAQNSEFKNCSSTKTKNAVPVVVMQAQGHKITAMVKSNCSKQKLHFYLFDLEGTMVHQSTLENRDKNTVAELKKGTYIYTVFANDESIDEGKIEIK